MTQKITMILMAMITGQRHLKDNFLREILDQTKHIG